MWYTRLSGGTSFSTISSMANSRANASVFRANNGGEDPIFMWFGYYWYPMLLSRDKSNNVVLTLWLANIYFNDYDDIPLGANFKYEAAQYGLGEFDYDGDKKNYEDPGGDVPDSVEVVTDIGFNNGYMYAPVYSNRFDPNSYDRTKVFNFFNADNYSMPDNLYKNWADIGYLTDMSYQTFLDGELCMHGQEIVDFSGRWSSGYEQFLVKPRNIAWQETQSAKQILGMSYNLSNESWSTSLSDEGFYSSNNNYAHVSGSDSWADEYAWLPSLSEIGYSGVSGLWGASTDQRRCYETHTSWFEVGYNKMKAEPSTWTRSANYKNTYGYYFIKPSGDGKAVGTFSTKVFRPCIHVNLTALESKR